MNAKSILGILVGILIYLIIRGSFSPNIEEEIARTCEQLNKTCPRMVDEETRLDKLVPGVGKEFAYHYTIVNHTKETLNVEMVKSMQTITLMATKSNPEMKRDIYDRGITVKYVYFDKNGEFLFDVVITP